ncbi:MAG TPA: dTDP-4-dehydrorhamnose 3,5-epimerase family protein [Chloroflexota bacterium]|nr:dTDP-4-dehydrorhamnose 3,5-epimerase family protein [Chloroflexota bacterium]
MQDFIRPDESTGMIHDVVVRPLRVNADPRGILVETLRTDWSDVYGVDREFHQTYYSVTNPGVARDEDRWHHHYSQEDRFVVLGGNIVLAIYDGRSESPTRGRLNLFLLGDAAGSNGQRLIVVPRETLHGFVVVGDTPGVLINYPTQLYNPADELRTPFSEANVTFSDDTPFTWERVRQMWREGATA